MKWEQYRQKIMETIFQTFKIKAVLASHKCVYVSFNRQSTKNIQCCCISFNTHITHSNKWHCFHVFAATKITDSAKNDSITHTITQTIPLFSIYRILTQYQHHYCYVEWSSISNKGLFPSWAVFHDRKIVLEPLNCFENVSIDHWLQSISNRLLLLVKKYSCCVYISCYSTSRSIQLSTYSNK